MVIKDLLSLNHDGKMTCLLFRYIRYKILRIALEDT